MIVVFYDKSRLCHWILLVLLLLSLLGSLFFCLAEPEQLKPTGHEPKEILDMYAAEQAAGIRVWHCYLIYDEHFLSVGNIGSRGLLFEAAKLCSASSLELAWACEAASLPLWTGLLLLPLLGLGGWLLLHLGYDFGKLLFRLSLVPTLLFAGFYVVLGAVFLLDGSSLEQELWYLLLAALPMGELICWRVWDP